MAGKGDRDRVSDREAFSRNFDAIRWYGKGKPRESRSLFDLSDYRCTICKDTGLVYNVGVLHECKCQL